VADNRTVLAPDASFGERAASPPPAAVRAAPQPSPAPVPAEPLGRVAAPLADVAKSDAPVAPPASPPATVAGRTAAPAAESAVAQAPSATAPSAPSAASGLLSVAPVAPAPATAGSTASGAAPPPTVGTWRQVVADYLVLTTADTLALLPENPRLAEAVAVYGQRLQLDLTADKLMLPMASLKDVRLYDYRGRPLVEAAYLSHDGTRVLALCIITSTQPDVAPAFEQRNGQNIVFWTARGHGFMLAGTAPRETLEAVARDLAGRLG
jgi:hypothetical protein